MITRFVNNHEWRNKSVIHKYNKIEVLENLLKYGMHFYFLLENDLKCDGEQN